MYTSLLCEGLGSMMGFVTDVVVLILSDENEHGMPLYEHWN